MKRLLLFVLCGLVFGLLASVSGKAASKARLTIELVDAQSGKRVPGVLRILDQHGEVIRLRDLVSADSKQSILPRGLGLVDQPAIEQWSVITEPILLDLPSGRITIEAFSGLNTELAKQPLDLQEGQSRETTVRLKTFCDPAAQGLRSANTHLHLMKLDREQADRYLLDVPRADGLDLLFVSYLERAIADREYITNRYSKADLKQLEQSSGTVFGNGEEHRHNLKKRTGYGHVMLLDLARLIQPVSIGQDISKTGTDGLPLQRGIDQARQDEATIIWCHNTMGLERVANHVMGRLDAQNIFDGGNHGSFHDGYYRILNAGLKVPFATGTDWFVFDFSRTYAKIDGPLTVQSWLKALKAGKSYITNGPFLEFEVAGHFAGGRLSLDRPASVSVTGTGIGRVDFQRIELIQNGRLVRSSSTRQEEGHFTAELKFELAVTGPCWLALRIPPPPLEGDPELTAPVPLNEYGRPLFAHTSSVEIQVGGRSYFDRDAATKLLAEMRENVQTIEKNAEFADAAEKARVVDVHHQAITVFERRLSGMND